jgi:hypothetical protein
MHQGGSDSVYSFFDVSGFKAGFGRKVFTDINILLVVNSDIQLKNARLSTPICVRGGLLRAGQRLAFEG